MYSNLFVVEALMREHQRDLLAEAEHYRLVKQAQEAVKIQKVSVGQVNANVTPGPDLLSPFGMHRYIHLIFLGLAQAMAYFGNRLLNWSYRLQTHLTVQ